MSDVGQSTVTGNGTAAVAASRESRKKRKIANASFDGVIGRIEFSNGKVIEVDPAKIPESIATLLLSYGAVNVVQTSYNNSDNPAATAETMLKRLYAGDWKPGLPRRDAEPDPLFIALAEHLKLPQEHVEAVYLPKYMEKHGLSQGGARRRLRVHPEIAPRIAEITAERAKRIAAAVRKAPPAAREELAL